MSVNRYQRAVLALVLAVSGAAHAAILFCTVLGMLLVA